jgi:hypothetical protein
MFGRRRHKCQHATEEYDEVFLTDSGPAPSMEPEVDELLPVEAEVRPAYIETDADGPILAVVASLDASLAKLSNICDCLQAAIEAWSMPAWDPSLVEMETTAQLVA